MLKGIPYWGASTFEDTETILNKVQKGDITDIAYSNIDLYDIVESLHDYVIVVDNKWLAWGRDIRFDYRDLMIFLPYYSYDTKNVNTSKRHKHLHLLPNEETAVHYNFQLHLKVLLNQTAGYKNFELVYADIKTLNVYRVNLNETPYFLKPFSIAELYKRFLNASYYDEDWTAVDFKNNYHWIGTEKGLNIESEIRSQFNLPTWKLGKIKTCTEQCKLLFNYNDIRRYDYDTLTNVYNIALNTDTMYYKRRYEFEAYLLLGVLSESNFIEPEFQKKYKKLGKSVEYLKYEEHGAMPLYLKHYYILNDSISKKTYERYKRIHEKGDII